MFHTTHLSLAELQCHLFLHLKSAIKKLSKYFNKNQQRLIFFNILLIRYATLVARLILLTLFTTIEVAGSSDNRSSRSAIPYSDTSNRLLNVSAVKKIKILYDLEVLKYVRYIVTFFSFEINNKFRCKSCTSITHFLFLSS